MKDSRKTDETKEQEEKRSKLSYKQLILIIFITTITVMFAMGFSFSIFDATLEPNQDNIINNIIAILRGDDDDDKPNKPSNDIIFSYYEKPFVGNGIRLYNQFPTRDEIGKAFEGENHVFEFRLILNKNAAGVRYDITAERLINSDLRNEAVKIYLENDGKVVDSVVRNTGRIKTFNEFKVYNKAKVNERVIYSSVITKAEAKRGYKDFVFKMWVSEDIMMTPDDNNRTFICRISVHGRKSY